METEYCKNIGNMYLRMFNDNFYPTYIINEIFKDYEVIKQLEIDLRSELSDYDMDTFYNRYDKVRLIVVSLAKQSKKKEEELSGKTVYSYDWIIEDF